jgi:hypothetical protein
MRFHHRLAVAILSAGIAGCAPSAANNYFQLDVGNTWEYRVVAGGEEGERWSLISDDPDDNDDAPSGRGDIYFRMVRTWPNPEPALPDLVIQMRSFNISEKMSVDEDVLGWEYKDVPADEGDRNEWFLKTPDTTDPDYTDGWDYELSGDANTEIIIDVEQFWCPAPLQTSYGTYADCLEVVRLKSTHYIDDEITITQTRHETWAAGYGLIRFLIIAGDGDETEGRLSATSVAARPGSE